jgi:cell volume regulation protein A
MRIRRETPGSLVVLADGRYAVTGPVLAIGAREDLTTWAKRRLANADPEGRGWWQGVIGALGADRF